MKLLFFKNGKDIISKTIEAITRNEYRHVAILTETNPDNPLEIYEAYWPKVHVRTLRPTEFEDVDTFEVIGLTDLQLQQAFAYWKANLGDSYSILDLFRFNPFARWILGDETAAGFEKRKFCSAYAFGGFIAAGVSLLQRVEPWQVSPAILSYSPFLSYVAMPWQAKRMAKLGRVTQYTTIGRMSTFGGENDQGVKYNEGLALMSTQDLKNPKYAGLFLDHQPQHTIGLARRLNEKAHYIAMRWDYKKTPLAFLRNSKVLVMANNKAIADVQPVDYGPGLRTHRIADLSPGLAAELGLKTDDTVTVTVPLPPVK